MQNIQTMVVGFSQNRLLLAKGGYRVYRYLFYRLNILCLRQPIATREKKTGIFVCIFNINHYLCIAFLSREAINKAGRVAQLDRATAF